MPDGCYYSEEILKFLDCLSVNKKLTFPKLISPKVILNFWLRECFGKKTYLYTKTDLPPKLTSSSKATHQSLRIAPTFFFIQVNGLTQKAVCSFASSKVMKNPAFLNII